MFTSSSPIFSCSLFSKALKHREHQIDIPNSVHSTSSSLTERASRERLAHHTCASEQRARAQCSMRSGTWSPPPPWPAPATPPWDLATPPTPLLTSSRRPLWRSVKLSVHLVTLLQSSSCRLCRSMRLVCKSCAIALTSRAAQSWSVIGL